MSEQASTERGKSVKEQAAGPGASTATGPQGSLSFSFCLLCYGLHSTKQMFYHGSLSILLTGCTLSTHKEEAGPY